MDIYDDEIVQLWNALAKHNVRYITVGDFASAFHGIKRHTGILSLWIDDTPENREHLANAFTELFDEDYSAFKTLEFIPGWTCFRFESGFEIDIMTDVKGLGKEHFEECFGIAPVSDILGVPVRFLHYNHLLRSKEAAGRPRDLRDIEELKKRNPGT